MLELHQLNENELFALLKDYHYPDLQRVTDDKYSSYDCVSDQYGFYVELKCRQTHYDELMIEKLKYDRIKNWADTMGMIPIYICSTPNGVWEFNLDVLDIEWQDRGDLPATTQFDNTERVSKVVGYLPVSKGNNLFPYYPDLYSEEEMLDELMVDFDKGVVYDE